MENLKQFWEFGEIGFDLEFEAQVLKKNEMETNLLIKKGYKIKKPVWTGLIAS